MLPEAMNGRRIRRANRCGWARRLRLLAAGAVLPWLVGCAQLPYYGQALRGHWAIMQARRPIAELIVSAQTDPQLRARLIQVQAIRRFAVEQLGLPDNGSYRSYVDLGRDAVTWNVYAAPAFSLEPRRWCFPVVGCMAYRGYFREADARTYARRLAGEGWDTWVGPVTAYSSLGWFEDPVLNTMLERGELATAGVLFHELAHQRVYLKGDSAFNESFATAVQRAGLRRWLRAQGDAARLAAYERYLQRRREFLALVAETRDRLSALYVAGGDPAALRRAKAAAFDRLRVEYEALKARWGGWGGFDRWFEGPLNNARLVPVALYEDRVDAFLALLGRCGDDLRRFYAAVERIGARPAPERDRALESAACGPDQGMEENA